jgi:hypothetical protein
MTSSADCATSCILVVSAYLFRRTLSIASTPVRTDVNGGAPRQACSVQLPLSRSLRSA